MSRAYFIAKKAYQLLGEIEEKKIHTDQQLLIAM
jgi:hypothetical protein